MKILLPVIPFSFQPFFCALSGIILGSKIGMLSHVIYIFLGLTGVPVFTQGGGPLYVLKPSFGFILGFAAQAYVTGKVSEGLKVMNYKNSVISTLSGLFALNLVGIPYMYLILKFYLGNPDITLMKVLSLGFFPFVLKDAFLFLIVAAVAVKIVPILEKAGFNRTRQHKTNAV